MKTAVYPVAFTNQPAPMPIPPPMKRYARFLHTAQAVVRHPLIHLPVPPTCPLRNSLPPLPSSSPRSVAMLMLFTSSSSLVRELALDTLEMSAPSTMQQSKAMRLSSRRSSAARRSARPRTHQP